MATVNQPGTQTVKPPVYPYTEPNKATPVVQPTLTVPQNGAAGVAAMPGVNVPAQPVSNQQVQQAGNAAAVQGIQSPVAQQTSQLTSQLLQDPTRGYDPNAAVQQQLGQYDRNIAEANELLRQQLAPTMNTSVSRDELARYALGNAQARTGYEEEARQAAIDRELGMIGNALAEGRDTSGMEDARFGAVMGGLGQQGELGLGYSTLEHEEKLEGLRMDLQRYISEGDWENARVIQDKISEHESAMQESEHVFTASESALGRAHELTVQTEDQNFATLMFDMQAKHDMGMLLTTQDFDTIQAELDRLHDVAMQNGDIAGRMKVLEAQQAFDKWAIESQQDFDREVQAWQSGENMLDRALQQYIADGQISVQLAELAQRSYEFDSQQEFEEWALEEGWTQDEVARAWQAGENAADRGLQIQLYELEQVMQEKGMNFTALMSSLEGMPADQAAQVMQQVAIDAGMTYTDAAGNVVEGLRPLTPMEQDQADLQSIAASLATGESITYEQADDILAAFNRGETIPGVNIGTTNYATQDSIGDYMLDKPGSGGGNRAYYLYQDTVDWAESNIGNVFKIDNKLMTLEGYYQPNGEDSYDHGYLTYRDVVTGETWTLTAHKH